MAKKYKIEQKTSEVNIICNKKCSINPRELETLKKRESDLFLVPNVSNENNKMTLVYETRGYTPLMTYLKKGIKRKDFLQVAYSCLMLNSTIKEKYMQYGNVLLDVNYVYIQERTGSIRYIYIPLTYTETNDNTYEYLKMLPFYCVFSRSEKHDYVVNYINHFTNMISFSIYEYSVLLEKIQALDKMEQSEKIVLLDIENNTKNIISDSVYTIGKSDTCSLCVLSRHISRLHAQIQMRNGMYYVQDCNSTNHTFVNGRQIDAGINYKLNSGDEITFADRKFRFYIER